MVDKKKNFKRMSTGDVFTGKQINELLALSSPQLQAVILLSIDVTDEPATEPKSRYGPAGGSDGNQ